MVEILTSPHGSLVQHGVGHCGCIEHRVELLNLQGHFFAILRQQWCELVDYGAKAIAL
jgi:hypothetical protein